MMSSGDLCPVPDWYWHFGVKLHDLWPVWRALNFSRRAAMCMNNGSKAGLCPASPPLTSILMSDVASRLIRHIFKSVGGVSLPLSMSTIRILLSTLVSFPMRPDELISPTDHPTYGRVTQCAKLLSHTLKILPSVQAIQYLMKSLRTYIYRLYL